MPYLIENTTIVTRGKTIDVKFVIYLEYMTPIFILKTRLHRIHKLLGIYDTNAYQNTECLL